MTEKIKLLDCPFCGSAPMYRVFARVSCSDEECTLSFHGFTENVSIGDAMAGYLRVCRSGGMTTARSNMIIDNVKNAERLGYFSQQATQPIGDK